jgi:excisionase family DNA binding protein
MDHLEVIEQLRERVARLEASKPRRVYNQQEVAQQLNVSVSKLRQELRAGRIKGTLNGRIWSFTDAAIEDYLAQLEAA